MLFANKKRVSSKIKIIDLSALSETLAIYLKNGSTRMIKLTGNNTIEFKKMNLRGMLAKQNELLKELLAEQKAAMGEQSRQLMEQEKERIKQEYQSNNRNKSKK